MAHGHGNGSRLQNLGPEGCHFQHFLECDGIKLLRLGRDPWIGRVDTIHIGINVTAVSLQRRRQCHRRRVRPATAKGCDTAIRRNPLKAGNDCHLPGRQTFAHQSRVDCVNARRAMHIVSTHRHLPTKP